MMTRRRGKGFCGNGSCRSFSDGCRARFRLPADEDEDEDEDEEEENEFSSTISFF
jgi:hypothetical protein